MLRAFLLVNALIAASVLAHVRPFNATLMLTDFVAAAAFVEPVLIACLALLCPLRPVLKRAGRWPTLVVIAAIELGVLAAVRLFLARGTAAGPALLQDWLTALSITVVVLVYFDLRERAYSPALAEARLAALQARIRPHFLFNSLNAVLGLIRHEPRRAEAALEDLSDLLRVTLSDERRLVPLADEIALCRRYLAIETLRLGERLMVEWTIDEAANAAAIPPFVMQPLVENAVHHGIEPASLPGTVRIAVLKKGGEVEIEIVNPRVDGHTQPVGIDGVPRQGNHMAIDNVRERLALHFDLESRLEARAELGAYRVRIVVPARPAAERKAP
jgi:two-component system sensor histidine kinase AlgZ